MEKEERNHLDEDICEITQLVVYDDDFNTFDWAIESIMGICEYNSVRSEQLCLMIHNKGQAVIKTGSIKLLKPMKEAFLNRGISAIIHIGQNN